MAGLLWVCGEIATAEWGRGIRTAVTRRRSERKTPKGKNPSLSNFSLFSRFTPSVCLVFTGVPFFNVFFFVHGCFASSPLHNSAVSSSIRVRVFYILLASPSLLHFSTTFNLSAQSRSNQIHRFRDSGSVLLDPLGSNQRLASSWRRWSTGLFSDLFDFGTSNLNPRDFLTNTGQKLIPFLGRTASKFRMRNGTNVTSALDTSLPGLMIVESAEGSSLLVDK